MEKAITEKAAFAERYKIKHSAKQGHYKKKNVKDIIVLHNTMPELENCS